jgi:malate dehydrogenase (oxaloacetate-decarboxylating)(NADP+)
MYIMLSKKGALFLADTTVNMNPTAQVLVDTTLLTAAEVRRFNIEPKNCPAFIHQFWCA